MRRRLIAAMLCVLLFCTACGVKEDRLRGEERRTKITEAPTASPTGTPKPTELPATPTPTPLPETGIDAGRYGFTVEEVLNYYIEVGMSSEYANGNNIDFVRKWTSPIGVLVQGDPDEDDWAVINALFDALNEVDGFPGIHVCSGSEDFQMIIRFLPRDRYQNYAQEAVGNESTDGYSLIWFDGGVLTRAEIGIRKELERSNKNHVILEEIVQALGLQNDSYSYPDSLFYQGYNEPQWPTDLDWLLVRFLYSEELKPFMKEDDVRRIAYEIIKE